MTDERGVAVNEVMRELAFRNHLRRLSEQRERRAVRKRKEGCIAKTKQPSNHKPLFNYTTEKEECQCVKSNRPEHTVCREIRQQERNGDLPVFLL